MNTPETLRRRLDTLGELRDIVRTMKALSAASIRQFELAVEALARYYRTVQLGLQALSDDGLTSRSRRRARGVDAVVVFGSDHGLCGAFNEDAVRRLVEEIETTPRPQILAVGARALAPLEDAGLRCAATLDVPGSARRISGAVQELLMVLDAWRSDHGLASLRLCYNHHTRRGAYRAVCVPVLPVDLRRLRRRGPHGWPSRSLPMHTLPTASLRAALVSQYLFVCAFRAFAESLASEHGSRLLAMQAAEKSLDQRIDDVSGEHRRARQAAITAELLDVVAGYEALGGERADASSEPGGRAATSDLT